MNTYPLDFRSALLRQIRKASHDARNEGTVKMSVENLIQITRPPSANLAGAPQGTNAQYFYRQMFREICQADKKLSDFTNI